MATSVQVEIAARRERNGPPRDTVPQVHLDRDPDVEEVERKPAAHHVRRLANRHGCEGWCENPEHEADLAEARTVLEALGLVDEDDTPEPEPQQSPLLPPTADERCGTHAGRKAHYRRGERPCRACREVAAHYEKSRYQARKEEVDS